jgi:hypothetical protein
MCWNEEVSRNTFFFSGFVLSLIIFNNTYTQYKIQELNNNWVYIFIASFITIQLIEIFIWRNINNRIYNNRFSILASVVFCIQPIISMMLLTNIPLRNVLLLIYCSLALPYAIYKLVFHTKQFSSVVSESGHLRYNFFMLPSVAVIGWLFFFLFSWVYEKKWVGVFFGLITLIISYLNYKNDNSYSSMWCWSVNSVMIYYAGYLLLYLPFLEKSSIC